MISFKEVVHYNREGNKKPGSLTKLRLHPNTASMAIKDLLTNRQSHAGAGILCVVMQTVKHRENFLKIFWFTAYPIIVSSIVFNS
jgi:hypothetical protein